MSARLLPVCLAALLAPAAPALAAPPSSPPKLVTATYQVADLVVPVDDAPVTIALNPAPPCPTGACPPAAPQCSRTVRKAPAAAKPRTREDRLIKLIMTTVAPQSWDSMG